MIRFLLPLGLFLALVAFLWKGLDLHPRDLPSPLIDNPAPAFRLPSLNDPARQFSPAELRGRVWILSVWASWCGACLDEHPVLVKFAREKGVTIVGLNYKDSRAEARAWLNQHGDPYLLSAQDTRGDVGIDYGVYGVPETFIVDKTGVIRFKYTGALTPEVISKQILPLMERLQ